MPICFSLFRQLIRCARIFARVNAGRSSAARIAMIAMTTSNSINVKPASKQCRLFADVWESEPIIFAFDAIILIISWIGERTIHHSLLHGNQTVVAAQLTRRLTEKGSLANWIGGLVAEQPKRTEFRCISTNPEIQQSI